MYRLDLVGVARADWARSALLRFVLQKKKRPAEAGRKSWKWDAYPDTLKTSSAQERGPLALGHDGLRIFPDRSLAHRILANRSLANRRRRRRRLLARQIGGGGSTQHRQGCNRCS